MARTEAHEQNEREQIVAVALAQLAAFRGATVAGPTIALFARRLLSEGCAVADIVAAGKRLELAERSEGELAFPSLATLLRVVREVVTARRAVELEADRAELKRLHGAVESVVTGEMSKAEARAFIERMKRDVAHQRRKVAGVSRRAS